MRTALIAVVVVASANAQAQSAELLRAVRLHAEDARARAETELKACSDCGARTRLALLAGYLALADGDAAAASQAFVKASPADVPGVAPWYAYYLGQAAFYRRDYAGAAARFAEAAKTGPESLRGRARARFAEAALAAGDFPAALPAFDEAIARSEAPELLHQRALARERAKQARGARRDRVRLAVAYATHPYGAEAYARLTKERYAFSLEERLARADRLLNAGDAEAALGDLDAAKKLARDATSRGRLALARAEALHALGRADEAEKELERALQAPVAVAAEASFLRARRALKGRDRAAALDAMIAVAARFPSRPQGEEADFYVGWLQLQLGRYPDAVKTFGDFVRRRPNSRRVDEILWWSALAQLRIPDYAGARTALDDLPRRFPRSSLVPQAKYWSARAAQLGGAKPEEIAPAYEELIAVFPASFYALLAQARLHDLGRAPPARFPDGVRELTERTPPELAQAVALSQTGLFRDASAEVEARIGAVRTADDALRFGHALETLGYHGHAHAVAARHLWGRAFGQKEPEAVALLYPRAFPHAVEAEAKAQSIPPELVWAIMRRESLFAADVVSVADARGLMQLLPRTASAIARERGEAPPHPDALFAPEINIRYGAWYLGRLWERFRHPALAAAAYNAGPLAVLGWVNGGRDLPLDLFVELIPYRETRAYVKQVVSDFHLYQSLYAAGGAERLALTLPEPGADGVAF